jgi:hypothetical protein
VPSPSIVQQLPPPYPIVLPELPEPVTTPPLPLEPLLLVPALPVPFVGSLTPTVVPPPELLLELDATGTTPFGGLHQPGGHTKPQPMGGGGGGTLAPASAGVGVQSVGSARLQH